MSNAHLNNLLSALLSLLAVSLPAAELANGAIGYIPNRPAYLEGNYEPVSARCAAGSGEMLVESAVRQLHALYALAAKEGRAAAE